MWYYEYMMKFNDSIIDTVCCNNLGLTGSGDTSSKSYSINGSGATVGTTKNLSLSLSRSLINLHSITSLGFNFLSSIFNRTSSTNKLFNIYIRFTKINT